MRQLLACAAVALVLPGCGVFYPPGNASEGGSAASPVRCAACPGDVAPRGRDGARGERGERGLRGEAGAAGLAGRDGPAGAKGTDGRDGKDGAEGQRGPAGRDGKDGRDGNDGRDGADGKDGRNGRDGIDGRDGKDGPPGPRGPAGTLGASEEDSLAKQLDRLLGRKNASCDCRPRSSAGPDAPITKPWPERLFDLLLAFLGGVGAFITACTPLLLGLLKIQADQKKEADKAPDLRKTAFADPPVLWIGGIVLLGGLFFTFLLYSFALAVLVFICAFMLCSSVLIVALGHAYRTIDGSMLAREKQAWIQARALEKDKLERERLARKRTSSRDDLGGGVGRNTTMKDPPKPE